MWVSLNNHKLYINWVDKTSDWYFVNGSDSDNKKFIFNSGREVEVSAGSSKTFELKATASNVSNDDYVSTKIKDDNIPMHWNKNELVNNGNATFVWSDNSGTPHGDTTEDWFNWYLVKGLNTTSTTLTN